MIAYITGATSGFGKAIARKLAHEARTCQPYFIPAGILSKNPNSVVTGL